MYIHVQCYTWHLLGEIQSADGSFDYMRFPRGSAGGAWQPNLECVFFHSLCSLGFLGCLIFQLVIAGAWVGDTMHGACAQVRTLRKGCLWWVAPPCSTWIYLARGSTGRTFTRPRGAWRIYQLYRCGMLWVYYLAWLYIYMTCIYADVDLLCG